MPEAKEIAIWVAANRDSIFVISFWKYFISPILDLYRERKK